MANFEGLTSFGSLHRSASNIPVTAGMSFMAGMAIDRVSAKSAPDCELRVFVVVVDFTKTDNIYQFRRNSKKFFSSLSATEPAKSIEFLMIPDFKVDRPETGVIVTLALLTDLYSLRQVCSNVGHKCPQCFYNSKVLPILNGINSSPTNLETGSASDVSLPQLSTNHLVFISGPKGCGKSTLFAQIIKLAAQDFSNKAQIMYRFCEVSLDSLTPNRLLRSICEQFCQTLGENITAASYIYSARGEIANEMLLRINVAISLSANRSGKVINTIVDSSILVWDLATGSKRHTLVGHSAPADVIRVQNNRLFSMDSTCRDQSLRIWDIEEGYCLTVFSPDAPVSCCQMSINGDALVCGFASETRLSTLVVCKNETVNDLVRRNKRRKSSKSSYIFDEPPSRKSSS